jgi:SAM-dependent methyltransferase
MLNDRLQAVVGDLRNFENNVDKKVVSDWCVLARHVAELDRPLQHLDYLEVGTGWYPTLPICYFLAGARRCLTFDIHRYLNAGWTFRMLRRLEAHLPAIAASSSRPLQEVEADYSTLKTADNLDELLHRARIEYHAPADAAVSGLPPASVDVVFSNSVLEHVPPDAIRLLMAESRRVLRPGGLSIHSANCGDHYAYFDRSITAINYLTYTSEEWRFWDNSLLYQNRLRPQDFLEIAQGAGLKVVLSKFRPRPELLAILPTLKITPEFAQYPPEQLASTSIDFVGQRT